MVIVTVALCVSGPDTPVIVNGTAVAESVDAAEMDRVAGTEPLLGGVTGLGDKDT